MEIKRIIINKNRGWRGLAELRCYDSEHNNIHTMVFSFSSDVWDDLLSGYIVTSDEDNFYIINFADKDKLPKGQRSVLIKNFNADVITVNTYSKSYRISEPRFDIFVRDFLKNNNNHTKSDWNCIGIRVTPVI